jgi:preprotein translocase subunit SecA
VEALRTSIGLEAYAQRDPLVAYKGRATEMFQELLANIRAGVVSRAFNLRPRAVAAPTQMEARASAVAAGTNGEAGKPDGAGPVQGAAAGDTAPADTGAASHGGGKRRRRRR